MSSYVSSFGTKMAPRTGKRYDDVFTLSHVVKPGYYKVPCNISKQKHIGFVSKFDQICSSPVMEEDQKKLGFLSESAASEEYFKELEVAVRAVQMACSLCQRVQDTLISNTGSNHRQVLSKDDNSPVTVAGECCLVNCVVC